MILKIIKWLIERYAPEYSLHRKPAKGLTRRRKNGHAATTLQSAEATDTGNGDSIRTSEEMEIRLRMAGIEARS
jgi:hypothetical protein